MTLGYPQGKAQIDAKAGALALSLRNTLRDIQNFQTFLAAKTTAELIALGYDETTLTEVSTLKSAFTDLNKLAQIANGAATQSTTYNFFQFAGKTFGVE